MAGTSGEVSRASQPIVSSRAMRANIARKRPMRRAVSRRSGGRRPHRIAMKTMLSMPRTISSEVRVRSATRFSAVKRSCKARRLRGGTEGRGDDNLPPLPRTLEQGSAARMAAVVVVRDLVKEFRRFRRREGLGGALKDLVSRRYESVRAVDGVSFSIGQGERIGYIGPNGAGKSTTIKMLTGILTPTAGEIVSLGLVPWRDRKRYVRRIGVVFGQRTQLWWDLAVIESFRLLLQIYEVPRVAGEERLKQLRAILDLDEFLHTPVRKLSLGQRMRADLAASLLHGPELLFLDEPTIGLDLVAKDAIRAFLRSVNEKFGTTILLTTHDLRDIELLAERV